MKLLPLAAVAALLCASHVSARGVDACAFESEFDLRIAPEALVFERDSGVPRRVVMRAGSLHVDGRDIALAAADVGRLRRYEATIRRLVPEVKAIAIDAVAIATEAVAQVAAGLSGRQASQAVEQMHALSERLVERIELADDTRDFDQAGFEREIATLTAQIVPALVGDLTASAIAAALSGDASAAADLEARARKLERELEQRVERRADRLEQRVQALCPRLAQLDALEASLELRLPGNAVLDLLQAAR